MREAISRCIHAASSAGTKCHVPRIDHVLKISRRVIASITSRRVASRILTPIAHSPLS